MEKGEIARNEQFLLFPQCFQNNQITVSPFVHIFDIISLFIVEFEKPKIGIKVKELTLYHTITTFNDPKKESFENIIGKGENASNQHFLHFLPYFLPY